MVYKVILYIYILSAPLGAQSALDQLQISVWNIKKTSFYSITLKGNAKMVIILLIQDAQIVQEDVINAILQ